jgi:hypothetical protein
MKKLFLCIVFISISILTFASEATELLEKAKKEYSDGNLTESIILIENAKKIIEKEMLNSSVDDYTEISNWDIIKVKKNDYIGKKVKVKAKFYGINSDGVTVHIAIGLSCTYETILADRLLELTKYQDYTFYGTVIDSFLGPMIHIENIE